MVSAALANTGCNYMTDRGRDAMDIFTLTGGMGTGVSARVGAVHAGLYHGLDGAGLKGGSYEWNRAAALRPGLITTDFSTGTSKINGQCLTMESFAIEQDCDSIIKQRAKMYEATGIYPFIMVPTVPDCIAAHDGEPGYNGKYPYYYWSQVEVIVGLGLSVRAGVNPGELLDFVLGWVGVDIYADDLNRKAATETEQILTTMHEREDDTVRLR
jgi:hypothetical protein